MAKAIGGDPLKKQKDTLNFKNSTVEKLAKKAGRFAVNVLAGPGPVIAKEMAQRYIASEGSVLGGPRYRKGVCYQNCGEEKYVTSSGMTKEEYERKKKKIKIKN